MPNDFATAFACWSKRRAGAAIVYEMGTSTFEVREKLHVRGRNNLRKQANLKTYDSKHIAWYFRFKTLQPSNNGCIEV